jgi:hypothetical protein
MRIDTLDAARRRAKEAKAAEEKKGIAVAMISK